MLKSYYILNLQLHIWDSDIENGTKIFLQEFERYWHRYLVFRRRKNWTLQVPYMICWKRLSKDQERLRSCFLYWYLVRLCYIHAYDSWLFLKYFLPLFATSVFVSATVGGAEIFPLLLHWIVLRLSVDPKAQEKLFNSLHMRADQPPSPIFAQTVSACCLDCPYSAAIGPPRKLVRSLDFEGYHLPAECIVFAMHPGLKKAPHR